MPIELLTRERPRQSRAAGGARGTILLLTAAGEDPGRYARFTARLAAQGYPVCGLGLPDEPTIAVRTVTAASRELVRTTGTPVILAGADTAGLIALAAAPRAPVRAVVVAGLPARPAWPVPTGPLPTGPVRAPDRPDRTRPAKSRRPARGRLTMVLPGGPWAALIRRPPQVPVLVLHGQADPVSPPAEAVATAGALPRAHLVLIAGARHDVLGDPHQRSAAAEVLRFLDRYSCAQTT